MPSFLIQLLLSLIYVQLQSARIECNNYMKDAFFEFCLLCVKTPSKAAQRSAHVRLVRQEWGYIFRQLRNRGKTRVLEFYSESRSFIQTSCPFPLLSPRKVPRVWHHTTIGEQTLQFRAAIGVRNGTVKRVSLEPLYTKRTRASIWIFLELRPDRGFTFQSCLLCCRCTWGT